MWQDVHMCKYCYIYVDTCLSPMRKTPFARVRREWKWRKNKKINVASILFRTRMNSIYLIFLRLLLFFVSQSKHQLPVENAGAATAASSTIVRAQIAFIHLFIFPLCFTVRSLWHFCCASCIIQATEFVENITDTDMRRLRKKVLCDSIDVLLWRRIDWRRRFVILSRHSAISICSALLWAWSSSDATWRSQVFSQTRAKLASVLHFASTRAGIDFDVNFMSLVVRVQLNALDCVFACLWWQSYRYIVVIICTVGRCNFH